MDAIVNGRRQGLSIRGSQFCIIVCGLHRSGTSAVTRLINILGADIADDLLPKASDNILGYWESRAVLKIHDQLLRQVGATPYDPFDPLALRTDWVATAAAQHAKYQLSNLIELKFADSRIFVVKDPRICRLLPLWVALLRNLDVAPIIVVPFRNPLEVAASLAQRDHVSFPKAMLLYFHSYLEADLASRSLPRLFVRYDDLLRDWRPFVRRLSQTSGMQFSSPTQDVSVEIDNFLTADLYHHRFSREQLLQSPDAPAAITEMFDRMTEAADTGDERALRKSFDRLGTRADEAAGLYRGFVIAERHEFARMRQTFELSTCWRITAPLRWLKVRLLSRYMVG